MDQWRELWRTKSSKYKWRRRVKRGEEIYDGEWISVRGRKAYYYWDSCKAFIMVGCDGLPSRTIQTMWRPNSPNWLNYKSRIEDEARALASDYFD
jgi:hypothetical protein